MAIFALLYLLSYFRVTPFMGLSKRKLLMNTFFTSQFRYCPLIWMCHSRSNNRKINMLHEKCLRIIYNDKQSSFTELLNKDNSVSIHIRNIQRLAIEMFRFYNGLLSPLTNNIFKLRAENPYNLRQVYEFSRPVVKSIYHGTESISYLGPKIWDTLPGKLKNIENIEKCMISLISLKLKIPLRNSCVVYSYYYRIYIFYFTAIL